MPLVIFEVSSKTYSNFWFEGDIDDLLSLKEAEIPNPNDFYIISYNERWNNDMQATLTRVFHDFANRGILWARLNIKYHNNPANDEFIEHVLFTANALSLFKKLAFAYIHEEARCFPGAELNKQLVAIEIGYEERNVDFQDFQSLRELLQTSTTLKSLFLKSIVSFDHETFSEGLSANKSLEKLVLCFEEDEDERDITDEGLSTIITSLRANTSFRELHLYTKGQVGTMTTQALNTLLYSSTTLTRLIWCDCCSVAYEDSIVDPVLQGLKQNRSLRNLKFHSRGGGFGDSFLSRLFDAVRDCPTLQVVIWGTNCEGDEHGVVNELKQLSTMTRLSRPIVLTIQLVATGDFFPVRDFFHALKRLVDSQPEIRLHQHDNDLKKGREYCNDFEHISKFNQHGRYLLDRPHFPMSMWPLVLEKANSEESIIYEFLKGQALAARHNFDNNNSEQSKAKRPRVG